ncbi:MAG: glucose-6-phosphate isomerase [Gemmatimonadota bacterium]|nr:glucose-6-phosphate isomerase [Gemmatimonadota bacterium]
MTNSGDGLRSAVSARLETFRAGSTIARLWNRDVTVWADDPATPEIADRLGWLDLPVTMQNAVDDLRDFADRVRTEFDRVVLLGMGGSSLAPEVLWRALGRQDGWPVFHMLDSTSPQAVLDVDEGGDLTSTLFLVASKSGTTLETMSFLRHFWERTGEVGGQFAAITDPGTPLAELGATRSFRRVFLNPPDVGGRFSALSLFGLVPAALMGVDVGRLLEGAAVMAQRCQANDPLDENPGATLGALLAEAAMAGHDKLTLVLSPRMAAFGLWAEQLIAESTGKAGKGILPAANEPPEFVPPFAVDRAYSGIWIAGDPSGAIESRLGWAERTGLPVSRLTLADPMDLGSEFFRWEFATAVAGAVLGVNPFDQPNVAESKTNTSRVLEGGAVTQAIGRLRRSDATGFFDAVQPRDYVCVQAFMAPNAVNDERLAGLHAVLRDRVDGVVTLGYGPRYLHSTGQLHKGGPSRGHFVQIVPPPDRDVHVPGAGFSFGNLIAAQALGDREALRARGRPVVRVSDPGEFVELM